MEAFNTPETKEYYLSVVKQLEDKFSKKHKIRLDDDYKHSKDEKIRSFISKRIMYEEYWSVYVSSGNNQCSPGSWRSVGDLYMLCLYYYPELCVEEFLEELVKVPHIACSYCNDVKKRVFHSGAYFEDTKKDENGLSSDFYYYLKQGIYHAQ